MAYESPIHMYTREIARNVGEELDKVVFTAINEVGVDVDKDELVKALEYDRDQYEKGYLDGRRYKPPVITRADQVRAMSDGELAEWIAKKMACPSYEYPCSELATHKKCCQCWLDWLLQEVDDDKPGQDQRDDG